MKDVRTRRTLVLAAGLALAATAMPARAHEFLIKPGATDAGQMSFTVESTHVFMAAEEMEAPDTVVVASLAGASATPVKIAGDAAGTSLQGSIAAPAAPALLLAHRLPQVWSQTPDGWKEGGRSAHPDAVAANRYEKFAKALIAPVAGAAASALLKPVGHPLEIVPLDNPATVKVGGDLRVKVLYNGEPLSTQVLATYDGFTDTPSSYAYATETYGEEAESGVAKIRLSAPGQWLVRVEHKAPDGEAGVDQHVMRATLVFPVR